MQGLITIIVWKLSTSASFKKRTISYDDVPAVMKNLIIFTIVVCILTGIYNIVTVNSAMDEAINSNYTLQFIESMMSRIYSDEQMEQYNNEKEKVITDAKRKTNTYLIILDIGLIVVYLAVLPLEKKKY